MPEDFSMKRKWGQLLSGASFLVLLVLFAANVIRAHTLGMDRTPSVWIMLVVPAALSDLVFGNSDGYTSFKTVSGAFYQALGTGPVTGDAIDQGIRAAMALDPRAVSSETQLVGSYDKGLVDFVKLSF